MYNNKFLRSSGFFFSNSRKQIYVHFLPNLLINIAFISIYKIPESPCAAPLINNIIF